MSLDDPFAQDEDDLGPDADEPEASTPVVVPLVPSVPAAVSSAVTPAQANAVLAGAGVVQAPAQPMTPTLAPVAAFEGHAVTATRLKVSGMAAVEMYDETVSLDDRVRMVGEYRVIGVAFRVDPKTGETVREQLLKPLDLTLCPWDPSDPADNGIVRAKAKP